MNVKACGPDIFVVFVFVQKSLVAKVQRREMPDMGMLFLNIKVRRSHLIYDSLNEVSNRQLISSYTITVLSTATWLALQLVECYCSELEFTG